MKKHIYQFISLQCIFLALISCSSPPQTSASEQTPPVNKENVKDTSAGYVIPPATNPTPSQLIPFYMPSPLVFTPLPTPLPVYPSATPFPTPTITPIPQIIVTSTPVYYTYTGGSLPHAYGGMNYALSDSPEVTTIEPAYNSTGISPTASFKLTFSEDVDKSSVEDGFVIQINTDQTTGTSSAFTVGYAYGNKGANVYDKSSYNISWNGENKVTFTPKAGFALPTDKNSNKIPQYRVTFKEPFQDKSGVYSRAIAHLDDSLPEDGPFRVTSTWKGLVPFMVATDGDAPKIDSVYITYKTTIKMKFTEPMALYTLTDNIYNENLIKSLAYELSIDNVVIPAAIDSALIDETDNSHSTIKLTTTVDLSSYSTKTLQVKIVLPLSDPAGNEITNENDKYKTVIIPNGL